MTKEHTMAELSAFALDLWMEKYRAKLDAAVLWEIRPMYSPNVVRDGGNGVTAKHWQVV